MADRRILSLWFPRLGAERMIRLEPELGDQALVVVAEEGNAQTVCSVNVVAQGRGVHVGQPIRDAHAMCDGLVAKSRNVLAEKRFLSILRRWAGKFSPWVSEEGRDALVVDLTGCAHLFGGEDALVAVVQDDCTDLGLSVHLGLADTRGAAWALARYAGQAAQSNRSGDAIDQEARATRSRAGKRRHWTKGGAAPVADMSRDTRQNRIAGAGQTYSALSPLPVAALRLDAETTAQLGRLGLRCVGDVLGQPRAALARRFGRGLVLRLDQAMGSAPEPISPARPAHHFAVRMSLPEPIGLADDVMAGVDRLLPNLCQSLKDKGRGMRCLQVQAFRTDHAAEVIEVGLARPTHDPVRIRPLIALKVDDIDAGFGIDMLRLEAVQHEPLHERTAVGHLGAGAQARARHIKAQDIEDLIGRLGARVGLDSITRLHPASSHIPEKSAQIMSAAWSRTYDGPWPKAQGPRPVLMWKPEPLGAQDSPQLPHVFRWRGREHRRIRAFGPERVAPEWWLDDPNWRSGQRDYWVTETDRGDRLWLFFGHGATMSAGWFCQGHFL
ncbi:DNA polymerase Y family protein [Ascidiaceihabitans sp.]|uniref:Y-family DNA polymerase n=1 Tax=Ascidiaceihabitans sp. TaxID=1872644 RepID=UPI003299B44E